MNEENIKPIVNEENNPDEFIKNLPEWDLEPPFEGVERSE